jgi:GH35 family endo-1,4-beta-xylanase
MVGTKLALLLMLTAGGAMGRSSNVQRLDRASLVRRDNNDRTPGGTPFGPGGAGGQGGNNDRAPGGTPFGPGGSGAGGAPVQASLAAAAPGGQQHWATDASGMKGDELVKNLPEGFFVGSAIDNPDLKDPLAAPLLKNMPYVTPGNSLKMQFVYENENSWTELLTASEKANGKGTLKWKYHTLIWGAETSQKMMQQSFSKEAMMKTITDFVTNKLCTKIVKETDFWGIDVLNEVFRDDGQGFKNNGYFEVIGEEGYMEVLKLVKKQCPNQKLIVNEYGMENANPKSDFAFKTIKKWLAQGVPVDVVGLQFHIGPDNKYEDMYNAIHRWTSQDIPVVLSEIDVPINLPPSPQDLEKQAQTYGNLMQAALEGGAFGATFWGMMDSHTWFGTQQDPGVGKGKVGAPLLFDAQGKPKPAFAAIVDVFKKWGKKQAGIANGRATDLGHASKGGAGDKSGPGSDESYGAGAGSNAGAGADAPGAGAGASGPGSHESYGAGAGAAAGGAGAGAPGAGAGSGAGGAGSGDIDMGPPDLGAAPRTPGAGGPGGAPGANGSGAPGAGGPGAGAGGPGAGAGGPGAGAGSPGAPGAPGSGAAGGNGSGAPGAPGAGAPGAGAGAGAPGSDASGGGAYGAYGAGSDADAPGVQPGAPAAKHHGHHGHHGNHHGHHASNEQPQPYRRSLARPL